jgi:hypothetical protein
LPLKCWLQRGDSRKTKRARGNQASRSGLSSSRAGSGRGARSGLQSVPGPCPWIPIQTARARQHDSVPLTSTPRASDSCAVYRGLGDCSGANKSAHRPEVSISRSRPAWS